MRLRGDAGRFGQCREEPLAELEITEGRPAAPGSTELWSQVLPDGSIQRATTTGQGDYVLETGEHRISLSCVDRVVTVADPSDWVETQLVASYLLPFLVSGDKTLVLHAAAASRSGQAVLVAGPGGAGKSSSLIGLIEAGWVPLSEDVCVIDLSGPEPLVWPGPPWVRRRHGEGGPPGTGVLFESSEKTAWDVGPFRSPQGPVPVAALILLAPPDRGVRPTRTQLAHGDALGALAPHAVWLGDRREGARRLFGPVAEAAARIPVSALRLPRRPDWVDVFLDLLV